MNDPHDPARNDPHDHDFDQDDGFDAWREHAGSSEDDWLDSLDPLDADEDEDEDEDEGDSSVEARFWALVGREMGAQPTGLPAPSEPAAHPCPDSSGSLTGRRENWAIGEAVDNTMNVLFGPTHPERITFDQMVFVAAEVWELAEVCSVFVGHLRRVSIDLAGGVHLSYANPVAVTIIRVFSESWFGCPHQDRN